MNIIGWNKIVPQLAVYFSVLARRPNQLTPFNLFLSGNPGTNKSVGSQVLVEFLGKSFGRVDSSTLDDVAELAGLPDMHALREHGVNQIAMGGLLKNQIVMLDEILNTRAHVMPQFRLLLQGFLSLLGNDISHNVEAFLAAGNLDEDMQAGQAQLFDSPTADRFAMIIRVPSMWEMTREDQQKILVGAESNGFAHEFEAAMQNIDRFYDSVEQEYGWKATQFVLALGEMVKGTVYAFEGRRAKLLRQFVIASTTLCVAETHRSLEGTLWEVVRDCMSYHKLAGLEMDEVELRNSFLAAFDVFQSSAIEAQIVTETNLSKKIGMVFTNLNSVSLLTKIDVLVNSVEEAKDNSISLAIRALADMPLFENQPPELVKLMSNAYLTRGRDINFDITELADISCLSEMQILAIELCDGDRKQAEKLLRSVEKLLKQWGV